MTMTLGEGVAPLTLGEQRPACPHGWPHGAREHCRDCHTVDPVDFEPFAGIEQWYGHGVPHVFDCPECQKERALMAVETCDHFVTRGEFCSGCHAEGRGRIRALEAKVAALIDEVKRLQR